MLKQLLVTRLAIFLPFFLLIYTLDMTECSRVLNDQGDKKTDSDKKGEKKYKKWITLSETENFSGDSRPSSSFKH